MRDFELTSLVLEFRDQEVPRLWDQLLNTDLSPEAYANTFQRIEAIEEAVGAAFGLDTSDINNILTCMIYVRAGEPGIALGETRQSLVRDAVARWKKETSP